MSIPDGRVLLRAAAAWLLCALILLALGALLANALSFGEKQIAYLSSAISFFAATAAGAAAAGQRRKGRFGAALFAATALVILLLSIGFVIRGEELDPSAVLSLASFSYAGCLFGSFVFGKPRVRTRTARPLPRN